MPVISGFGALAELPWERVTDKIERRVLAGRQGMIVWWRWQVRPADERERSLRPVSLRFEARHF
jgi:hypothetical protein